MNVDISGNAKTTLTRTPGGPDPMAIAEANIRDMASRGFNNYVVVEGRNQGTNEFPYQPFLVDPYDSIAGLKKSAALLPGSQMVVSVDKEDVEYQLRQRAQVENADFDRWVLQKYDLSNPGDRMVAQRVIPELFDRQKETLAYQTELQNKYAKLRIDGPKSDDDLKFEWLVESGRLQLPEGPLWDPRRWMNNQLRKYENAGVNIPNKEAISRLNRARFMKGLFNPIRGPFEGDTGKQTNYNNPSDIRGQEAAMIWGQYYTGSQAEQYASYGLNPIVNNIINYQQRNVPDFRTGVGYQQRANAFPAPPPSKTPAQEAATDAAYLRADTNKGYGRKAGLY